MDKPDTTQAIVDALLASDDFAEVGVIDENGMITVTDCHGDNWAITLNSLDGVNANGN